MKEWQILFCGWHGEWQFVFFTCSLLLKSMKLEFLFLLLKKLIKAKFNLNPAFTEAYTCLGKRIQQFA